MIDREIPVRPKDEFVFPPTRNAHSLLHLPTLFYLVVTFILTIILAILFSVNNILIGLVFLCIPFIIIYFLTRVMGPIAFLIRSQNSMVINKDSQHLFQKGNPIVTIFISKNQLLDMFNVSLVSYLVFDGERFKRKEFGIYSDDMLNKILVNGENCIKVQPILKIYPSEDHLQTLKPTFKM